MQASKYIAHLALFMVAVIYGANYYVAKSVMPDPIGPKAFIFVRVTGAVLIFWVINSFFRQKIDKSDYWRFLVCGLTGVAINQLFFFEGLALTSLSNASIIMTTTPILVLFMSAFILNIKPNGRKKIGIALGAIGAISLIVMSNSDTLSNNNSLLGDLYILINAISYAVYLVMVKPLMAKYKPLTVISMVFLVGFIFVTPFGAQSAMEIDWTILTQWQFFAVGFVIIATTCMAYLLNIFALSRVNPTQASSYIYLQPIMALLFAWVFSTFLGVPYQNEITYYKIICALLIFTGIYLVSVERKKPQTITG